MIPIVKIRGLPLSAKSHDIRALFGGLLIPDGAVHVIGGAEGLAFIAFGTFEDAKQAVNFTNAEIHGHPIVAEWSTETEMCKIISDVLRSRNRILSSEFNDHAAPVEVSRIENAQELANSSLQVDNPGKQLCLKHFPFYVWELLKGSVFVDDLTVNFNQFDV